MDVNGDRYFSKASDLVRARADWDPGREQVFAALYRRALPSEKLEVSCAQIVRTPDGAVAVIEGHPTPLGPHRVPKVDALDVYLTEEEALAGAAGQPLKLGYRRDRECLFTSAGQSARCAVELAATVAIALARVGKEILDLHGSGRVDLDSGLECLQACGVWDAGTVADVLEDLATLPADAERVGSLPETAEYIVRCVWNLLRNLRTNGVGAETERTGLEAACREAASAVRATAQELSTGLRRPVSVLSPRGLTTRETSQDPMRAAEFFLPNRELIYTPQGDLLLLPAGSTGYDLAYALHSDLLFYEPLTVNVDGMPQTADATLPRGCTAVLIAGLHLAEAEELLRRAVLVHEPKARSILRQHARDEARFKVLEPRLWRGPRASASRTTRRVRPGANPYTPFNASGVNDPMAIYGRLQELRDVLRELDNGNSVTIRGEKRAGKTTFGNLLTGALTRRRLVVSVDMRNVVRATDVVQAIAHEIAEQFSAAAGVSYDRSTRSLRDVVAFIGEHQGRRSTVIVMDEIRALLAVTPPEALGGVFSALEGALTPERSATQQVYIVHRDFETACNELGLMPFQLLANYSQQVLIKELDEGIARSLITRPAEGLMAWSPSAVDRVIWWTGCYPEQIHGLCHEVYEMCTRSGVSFGEASSEMVDEAAKVKILSNVFDSRWIENTDAQRLALACLAHIEPQAGGRTYPEIVERAKESLVDVTPDELWPGVRELAADGILRLGDTDEPRYSFSSPLFEAYVRTHYRPGAISGYEAHGRARRPHDEEVAR